MRNLEKQEIAKLKQLLEMKKRTLWDTETSHGDLRPQEC